MKTYYTPQVFKRTPTGKILSRVVIIDQVETIEHGFEIAVSELTPEFRKRMRKAGVNRQFASMITKNATEQLFHLTQAVEHVEKEDKLFRAAKVISLAGLKARCKDYWTVGQAVWAYPSTDGDVVIRRSRSTGNLNCLCPSSMVQFVP